jgi:ubiquinone/menaquinone biosynthesis C-methylase UbiE
VSSSPYRLGHYLLGIEGLALLRSAEDDDGNLQSRLKEMRSILEHIDEKPYAESRAATPVDTVTGYAAWAASYDSSANPTVELEEDVVRRLLDELAPGSTVLDAACGTGRHAVYLSQKGHDVVGVDSSSVMLERARERVPNADFRTGELTALPLEDESVDAAICALALSHQRDISAGVDELARVVRPGGRVIVSNPHPFATEYLYWRATVAGATGDRLLIPEFAHSHAASIRAFVGAGLQVRGCFEPALSPARAEQEAKAGLSEAFGVALTGFPIVVVWDLAKQ